MFMVFDVLCSIDVIWFLGSIVNLWLVVFSVGLIWLGIVVVVIVCLCCRYGLLVWVDIRLMNCLLIVDIECILVEVLVGIW